jgi:hypothetical protein
LVAVEIRTFQGDGMDLHDGSSPQERFEVDPENWTGS